MSYREDLKKLLQPTTTTQPGSSSSVNGATFSEKLGLEGVKPRPAAKPVSQAAPKTSRFDPNLNGGTNVIGEYSALSEAPEPKKRGIGAALLGSTAVGFPKFLQAANDFLYNSVELGASIVKNDFLTPLTGRDYTDDKTLAAIYANKTEDDSIVGTLQKGSQSTTAPAIKALTKYADVQNESGLVQGVAGGLESLPTTLMAAVPYIGTALIATTSFQTSMEQKWNEAEARGEKPNEANILVYSLGSAAIEAASERLSNIYRPLTSSGAVMVAKGGRPTLVTGVKHLFSTAITPYADDVAKPTAKAMSKLMWDAATDEGMEEVYSALATGSLAKWTTDKDAKLFDLTDENALISLTGLAKNFIGGATLGFLFPLINNAPSFVQSRKVLAKTMGKPFQELTDADVTQAMRIIRGEAQTKEGKAYLAAKLAGDYANLQLTGGKVLYTDPQSGDQQAFRYSQPNAEGQILLKGDDGQTMMTVSNEEFDAGTQAGLFQPVNLTQPAFTQATPATQAVNDGSLPVEPMAQAGVAPQITERATVAGEPARVAQTSFSSKTGARAVRAETNGKTITLDIGEGVNGYSVTVNAEDYAKRGAQALREAAAKNSTPLHTYATKHVAGEDYQGFWNSLTSAADAVLGDYTSTQQAKAQEEAVKAYEAEVAQGVPEDQVDRLRKVRDTVHARTDKGDVQKETTRKQISKVEQDLKAKGKNVLLNEKTALSAQHKAAKDILEASTGKKIVYIETAAGQQAINGFVTQETGDTIFINADANINALTAIGHEIYHLITREGANTALESAMLDSLGLTREQLIDKYLSQFTKGSAYRNQLEANPDATFEEAMADRCGELFSDRTFLSRLSSKLGKRKYNAVIAKLKQWLTSVRAKVPASAKEIDALLEALTPLKTVKPVMDETRGVALDEKSTELLKDQMLPEQPIEDLKFSYINDVSQQKAFLKAMGVNADPKILENMAEPVAILAKYAEANPDILNRMLISTLNVGKEPFRTNAGGYIYSLDFDTSCTRVLDYANFVNEVTKRINRPMTKDEMLTLVFMMRSAGIMIPCVYCYVESKRQTKSDAFNSFNKIRAQVQAGIVDGSFKTVDQAYSKLKGQMYGKNDAVASLKVFERWFNDRESMTIQTSEQLHVGYNSSTMRIMDYLDDPANGFMDLDPSKFTGNTAKGLAKKLAAVYGIEERAPGSKTLSKFVQANAKKSKTGTVEGYDATGKKLKKTGEEAEQDTEGLTYEFRALRDIATDWINDRVMGKRAHTYGIYPDARMDVSDKDLRTNLAMFAETLDYQNAVSSAKKVERYAQYVDQVFSIPQKDKLKMNARGGARIHSSNDARIDHYLDYITALSHFAADKRGGDWFMHAYTKDLVWADFFRNTNIRINVSIAMTTRADGAIVANTDEGADWARAQALRAKSKNVGTMAMVVDDAQLLWALEQDWIDMIIPFHASGMTVEVFRDLMKYTDYTSSQRDVAAKDDFMREQLSTPEALQAHGLSLAAVVKLKAEDRDALYQQYGYYGKPVTILRGSDNKRVNPEFLPYSYEERGVTVPGHGNDARNMIDLCKKLGVQPRFYDLMITDKDGKTIRATEHPNYVKLIKETARTDSKQEGIVNEFDPQELETIMAGHIKAGGYLKQESYTAESDKFGIVDSFVNENLERNDDGTYHLPDDKKATSTEAFDVVNSMTGEIEQRPSYLSERMYALATWVAASKADSITKAEWLASSEFYRDYTDTEERAIEKAMAFLNKARSNANFKDLTSDQRLDVAVTAFGVALQREAIKQELDDSGIKYSLREEAPPKNTVRGYKVFQVKNGKLYPPMVANPDKSDTPIGAWVNADVGEMAPYTSKTGRLRVKSIGGGSLAFRPGWHLGALPFAPQFYELDRNTNQKVQHPDFVWAECEVAADKDYQDEAMSYGYTKTGKFRHSLAGLPALPKDGYYTYRTNPNPKTTPWMITGAMKVNRLLDDAEVRDILVANNITPMGRAGGPIDLGALGIKYAMMGKSELEQKAVDTFGTTTDPLEAGYILQDGKALDFSGKIDGGEPGTRSMDHRDIADIYPGLQGTAALNQFLLDTGAVRVSITKESALFDITGRAALTDAQQTFIRKNSARKRAVTFDYYQDNSSAAPTKSWGLDFPTVSAVSGVLSEISDLQPAYSMIGEFGGEVGDIPAFSSPFASWLVEQDMSRKRGVKEWDALISKAPFNSKYEYEFLGIRDWLLEQPKSVTATDIFNYYSDHANLMDEVLYTSSRDWSEYTPHTELPDSGGVEWSNYRVNTLTMSKDAIPFSFSNEHMRNHFIGVDSIMMHTRMEDVRTPQFPNGATYLVEAQSDLHAAGQQEGYTPKEEWQADQKRESAAQDLAKSILAQPGIKEAVEATREELQELSVRLLKQAAGAEIAAFVEKYGAPNTEDELTSYLANNGSFLEDVSSILGDLRRNSDPGLLNKVFDNPFTFPSWDPLTHDALAIIGWVNGIDEADLYASRARLEEALSITDLSKLAVDLGTLAGARQNRAAREQVWRLKYLRDRLSFAQNEWDAAPRVAVGYLSEITREVFDEQAPGKHAKTLLDLLDANRDDIAQSRDMRVSNYSAVATTDINPEAPFGKDYMLLGFKLALRDAIIQGHDAVMWAGWLHAKRWTVRGNTIYAKVLGQRTDSEGTSIYDVEYQSATGGKAKTEEIWEEHLDTVFGPAVADQLRTTGFGHGQKRTMPTGEKIENNMIARMYDEELVKQVAKYTKQWGVAPVYQEVEGLSYQWVLPINEAMRDTLLNTPQVAYSMRAEHSMNRMLNEEWLSLDTLGKLTEAHRFYNVQTNKKTLDAVALKLRANRSAAEASARDINQTSAIHTALRLYFLFEADVNGDPDASAEWVYIATKSAKNAGQAIQAYKLASRMSSASLRIMASREVESFISDREQENLDRLTAGIVDAVNGLEKQMVGRAIFTEAEYDRIYDEQAHRIDLLEKRLANMEKDIGLFKYDPIKQYLEALHDIAAASIPFEQMPKTSSIREFMRWAIDHPALTQDMWGMAYDVVSNLRNRDSQFMQTISGYFDDYLPETHKRLKLTPRSYDDVVAAIKAHYAATDHSAGALMKRLSELGVDPADAAVLTHTVMQAMAELTKATKAKMITRVLPPAKRLGKQTPIERLVNLSNEHGLTDSDVRATAAKFLGLPALSVETAEQIRGLADEIADIQAMASRRGTAMTEEEQRLVDFRMAQILALIQMQKPVGLLDKVETFRQMMMLSMFKSMERNIIGNTLFAITDTGMDYISAFADHALAKISRTNAVIPWPDMKAALMGAKKGYRTSKQDILAGVDTSELDTGYSINRGQVFKSKAGKLAMTIFRLKMSLPDRVFQTAAYESHLAGLKTLNAKRAQAQRMTEQEMVDESLYFAQRKTFTDDNVISNYFSKFRQDLNRFSTGGKSTQFGLGSMIMPFTRVPGALLMRTIEYSPVSLIRAVVYLGKHAKRVAFNNEGKAEWEKYSQKKIVNALTDGIFGSAVTIGLGILLRGLGLITGEPPEDTKKRNMLTVMGISTGYMMNWTGLRRFIFSGFDGLGEYLFSQEHPVPGACKKTDGDIYTPYSWAAPMSLGMSIGANLVDQSKDIRNADMPAFEKYSQMAMLAMMSGTQSIADMSLMSGVSALINSGQYTSNFTFVEGEDSRAPYVIEAFLNAAATVPASFLHNGLKIARELTDNAQRNSYARDYGEYAWNLMVNRLPIASKTLAPRYDVLGNARTVYQSDWDNPAAHILNVIFNPTTAYRYTPDPEAALVLNLMAAKQGTTVEDTNITPPTIKRYLKYTTGDGVEHAYQLTAQEQAELQRVVGERVKAAYATVPRSGYTVEEMTKWMGDALNTISKEEKTKLLEKVLGGG